MDVEHNILDDLPAGIASAPAGGDGLTQAKETLGAATQALEDGDVGAHWADDVIQAARLIFSGDKAAFAQVRANLKAAHKEAQITEWAKEVKQSGGGDEPASRADELVALVADRAELFTDPQGTAYATYEQAEHRETWAVGSRGFTDWLNARAYKDLGFVPSETAIKGAVSTLAGIAKHDGEERSVYLRAAPAEAGGYLVDMTDPAWRAIHITATGWTELERPEARFTRSQKSSSFPRPRRGGDLHRLWTYANIPEPVRPLVLAFILECWRPDTPYPTLELTGGQGTGKSTTHRALRACIDPNSIPLRTAPKEVQDLFVSAGNNHLPSYENLSHASAKLQDGFCVLNTGGGYAARKLYSDDDENVIEVKRPAIINGIVPIATRPDFIDRAIHVDLPPIPGYETESAIQREFDDAYPEIMGGLFDLFAETLRALPLVKVEDPPRMADFAHLGAAMFQAQGKDPAGFVELYRENRRESLHRSLETSPAALAVLELVSVHSDFSGPLKDLKTRLEADHRQDGEGWPSSPRGLGDILRRTAPALAESGVKVEFLPRRRDGYHVRLFRFRPGEGIPKPCSQRSHVHNCDRDHAPGERVNMVNVDSGLRNEAEKKNAPASDMHQDQGGDDAERF